MSDAGPAAPPPDGPAPRPDGSAVPPSDVDEAARARAELAARLSVTGTWVLRLSWWTTALFAVATVPALVGPGWGDDLSAGISLALFALSLVAWADGFARAAARTTRGDDISVANLYFLQGSAPSRIRRNLFGSLFVTTAIAFGAAAWAPFGVLVPSLPLALVGEWAARYGVFPPREDVRRGPARRRAPADDGPSPAGTTPPSAAPDAAPHQAP